MEATPIGQESSRQRRFWPNQDLEPSLRLRLPLCPHRRGITMKNRSAFTLIELLVVIAIIAILAAILFPVFAQAKLAAKKIASLSNVKQLDLGILMYSNDHDDVLP